MKKMSEEREKEVRLFKERETELQRVCMRMCVYEEWMEANKDCVCVCV